MIGIIDINTAVNSGFTQWRELFKPVADFPLENLILAETNQSRTSPLREAGGTLGNINPTTMGTREFGDPITMQLFSTLVKIYRSSKENLEPDSKDEWKRRYSHDALIAFPMAIMVWESYLYNRLFFPTSGLNFQNHIISDLKEKIDNWDIETKSYILPKWILGQTFDKSSQPFQDFKKIIQLRNSIVHFKWESSPVNVVKDLAQRKFTIHKPSNQEFSWTMEICSIECYKWAINTIVEMIFTLESYFPETHKSKIIDFYKKVE